MPWKSSKLLCNSLLALAASTKKGGSCCWLPYPEPEGEKLSACLSVCGCLSLQTIFSHNMPAASISYLWSHVMGPLPLFAFYRCDNQHHKKKILSLLTFPIGYFHTACVILWCLFAERLIWRPFCRTRRGKEDGGANGTTVGAGMRKWPSEISLYIHTHRPGHRN